MRALLHQRQKRNGFLYSDLYLWLLTATVVCAWHFGQVILGFITLALTFCLVMFLHDDATPALPILIIFSFIIPIEAVEKPIEFISQNFVFLLLLIGLLVASVIVFFISNRRRFTVGKQFIGLIVGAVAFLCSGLLYDLEVWTKSIPYVAIFIFVVFFVYLLCINGISRDLPKQYFAKIFMHVGIVMATETILFYVFAGENFETLVSTKALKLGWGVSNNVGDILLLTIPMTLYLLTRRNNSVINTVYYALIFIVQLVTLVLTLSRGSMLIALIGIPVCVVYACITARNKKRLFICLGAILCVVVGLVVWQWESVQILIGEYAIVGGDGAIQDSGRFDLYLKALEDFLKCPITGLSPFHANDPIGGVMNPFWYHCSPLQILANAGIFGIIGYVLHLFSVGRVLIVRRTNKINRFILLAILMWLLHGLIDVNYNFMVQLIMFVVLLAFAEQGVPKNFKVFGRNGRNNKDRRK